MAFLLKLYLQVMVADYFMSALIKSNLKILVFKCLNIKFVMRQTV